MDALWLGLGWMFGLLGLLGGIALICWAVNTGQHNHTHIYQQTSCTCEQEDEKDEEEDED